MMSRTQTLQLYKSLLRESQKFSSYNFRMYALRRIKDSFRQNKDLTESNSIKNKFEEAANNLELIKRQVIVAGLYSTDKLVIEHNDTQK